MDLGSRRILGWHASDRIDENLVTVSLLRALKTRRDAQQEPPQIFHSDRGSQYASKAFRALLHRLHITQSMSRKGNCWDNAIAESFFAILKEESGVLQKIPANLKEARTTIYRYIEFYYNRLRIHSSLGYLSPVEFELKNYFTNLC